MSVSNIYSVYDVVANVYSVPFFAMCDSVALRLFRLSVMDLESMICRFPSDYQLHYLGTFDDVSGVVTSVDSSDEIVSRLVVCASELVDSSDSSDLSNQEVVL